MLRVHQNNKKPGLSEFTEKKFSCTNFTFLDIEKLSSSGGGDLTRIEESNSTESLSAESNSTEREERGDIELTRDLFSDAMFEVSREMEESRQKARQHKQDSQQLSDREKLKSKIYEKSSS